MLNIDQFTSKINEVGGLVNSSKFMMRINAKSASWLADVQAQDLLHTTTFFIDSVNLPGKTFVPTDIRQMGYGPLERRPITQTFSELTCTIMLDRKGNNLGLFNRWMDYILGADPVYTNTKNENLFAQGQNGYAFELAYPTEYMTDIDIFILDQHITYGTQVDPERNCVAHYKIYDAYPYAIGDVDLNWNNNNTIARMPISFYYKMWEAVQHTVSTGPSGTISSGATNDSGLPNVGVDISIGPGGVEGGVTVQGEQGSVRIGTSGVSGTLRTGIGDINISPAGRVSTQINIPITDENQLPVRK